MSKFNNNKSNQTIINERFNLFYLKDYKFNIIVNNNV